MRWQEKLEVLLVVLFVIVLIFFITWRYESESDNLVVDETSYSDTNKEVFNYNILSDGVLFPVSIKRQMDTAVSE